MNFRSSKRVHSVLSILFAHFIEYSHDFDDYAV